MTPKTKTETKTKTRQNQNSTTSRPPASVLPPPPSNAPTISNLNLQNTHHNITHPFNSIIRILPVEGLRNRKHPDINLVAVDRNLDIQMCLTIARISKTIR